MPVARDASNATIPMTINEIPYVGREEGEARLVNADVEPYKVLDETAETVR